MTKLVKFSTLEEEFLNLKNAIEHTQALSIEKILKIMHGKGRALIMMILALPFCQPLQIPGLSTPFGLIIAFLGLRTLFGNGILLPKFLIEKKLKRKTVEKIIKSGLALVRKLKKVLHPRLIFLCQSKSMRVFNEICIVFLGLFLALPLPIPLSNLIAAWAILWLNLGILEDDGLIVLFGYFFFFVSLVLFGVIVYQLAYLRVFF